ncbi:hypothetical protein ELH53_35545 [Rhizobium ruizarguesonis]|uniref:Uncharacterized protein n=1 Tax=Rhizobium ruizarguesonis TaxID=2081791 RepID=A0AAE4YL70_9HYPH|nr:hypothetical protein [Rhizobium ruizarguesonis]NKL10740.1 hypothetical protein [Rhizobium leguminosarum bv. viciae]NEI11294.1 hypothetical protein [Rhizobium ruizarguesonis]NEI22401.1 hypothetical protein [Rhizobium ruizarguesonis]NEI46489.1 hypothetical protein [Rhizobium ruizarguesonis]
MQRVSFRLPCQSQQGSLCGNGELPSAADIDGLAWHFLGVLQAAMNLPQAGASGRVLRRVIDLGMSARPLK